LLIYANSRGVNEQARVEARAGQRARQEDDQAGCAHYESHSW